MEMIRPKNKASLFKFCHKLEVHTLSNRGRWIVRLTDPSQFSWPGKASFLFYFPLEQAAAEFKLGSMCDLQCLPTKYSLLLKSQPRE